MLFDAHALSQQALFVTHNTRESAQGSDLQLDDRTMGPRRIAPGPT
jgi:hypothetical protein